MGNVIRNGVSVAIIGKPNAGKSTLLNSLLNENRAIVSDIPGTTRDTVEEVINIDGILFRLIDTAGIRQHSTDVIEIAGIERSLEKMQKADLILYVFDVNKTKDDLILSMSLLNERGNYLLVANKVDEVNEINAKEKFSDIEKLVFISAKHHLHIDILKVDDLAGTRSHRVEDEKRICAGLRGRYKALVFHTGAVILACVVALTPDEQHSCHQNGRPDQHVGRHRTLSGQVLADTRQQDEQGGQPHHHADGPCTPGSLQPEFFQDFLLSPSPAKRSRATAQFVG